MKRKKHVESVVVKYANYLRDVMPLVASKSRYPKLAEYEHQIALLEDREKRAELIKEFGIEKANNMPKYTARSVHTQVWRAMQYLVEKGEVKKIGKCYYPVSEEGLILYEILLNNIILASPKVHIISRTAFAISIEKGQSVDDMKAVLKSCVGEEFLFGSVVQDDVILILLAPEAPKELLAEFVSWVSDAYVSQHSKKRK